MLADMFTIFALGPSIAMVDVSVAISFAMVKCLQNHPSLRALLTFSPRMIRYHYRASLSEAGT